MIVFVAVPVVHNNQKMHRIPGEEHPALQQRLSTE